MENHHKIRQTVNRDVSPFSFQLSTFNVEFVRFIDERQSQDLRTEACTIGLGFFFFSMRITNNSVINSEMQIVSRKFSPTFILPFLSFSNFCLLYLFSHLSTFFSVYFCIFSSFFLFSKNMPLDVCCSVISEKQSIWREKDMIKNLKESGIE